MIASAPTQDNNIGMEVSCKGINKRQKQMNLWEVIGCIWRKSLPGKQCVILFGNRHVVTYDQSKLGLSAYYHSTKEYVTREYVAANGQTNKETNIRASKADKMDTLNVPLKTKVKEMPQKRN